MQEAEKILCSSVQPVLHVWAASGFLSSVQHVPHLFAKVCTGGSDPRNDEIQLVGFEKVGMCQQGSHSIPNV